MLECNFN